MAKLLSTSIEVPDIPYRDPDYRAKRREQLQAIKKTVKDKRPNDELAGEILQFQVADGYAQYLVKSSKPLTLQHVQDGDGYSVHHALIRGLRLEDVRDQVESHRKMRELFPGSSG